MQLLGARRLLPHCCLFSQEGEPSKPKRFRLIRDGMSHARRPEDQSLFDNHLEKRQQAKEHLKAARKLVLEAKYDLRGMSSVVAIYRMGKYLELDAIQKSIKDILSPTADEHTPNPPRL